MTLQASRVFAADPIQLCEAPFMTLFFAIFCSSAFAWEVRLDEAGQELSWQADEIPYSINAKGALGLSQAAVETLVAAATATGVHPWRETSFSTNKEAPTSSSRLTTIR